MLVSTKLTKNNEYQLFFPNSCTGENFFFFKNWERRRRRAQKPNTRTWLTCRAIQTAKFNQRSNSKKSGSGSGRSGGGCVAPGVIFFSQAFLSLVYNTTTGSSFCKQTEEGGGLAFTDWHPRGNEIRLRKIDKLSKNQNVRKVACLWMFWSRNEERRQGTPKPGGTTRPNATSCRVSTFSVSILAWERTCVSKRKGKLNRDESLGAL